jgi:hypothetical protein
MKLFMMILSTSINFIFTYSRFMENLFMTNVNLGYGVEVRLFPEELFDFNASFRRAYGQKSDFVRDVAEKNSDVLNDPKKFYYAELGAGLPYH